MIPNDVYRGYQPAPAAPDNAQPDYSLPLEQDPTYLAYLRSSGLINQQAQAAFNQRSSALQAALQAQLPGMQRDAQTQQRNLGGGYEDRGMLRSGAYLRDSAELADRQQRAQNAAISGVAGDISNEASRLAQTIADQNQKAAEAGLAAADRLTQYRYNQQNQGY